MKTIFYLFILFITILFTACSSPVYIRDTSSYERQKDLINSRSAAVVGDVLLATTALVSAVVLETDYFWYPSETRFKKISLLNPANDTLYVNMLTDVYWDTENYCDFMDIRIPPRKTCRILCPVDAEYNIYFSNTSIEDDDDMLTINTRGISKLKLKPGSVFSEINK